MSAVSFLELTAEALHNLNSYELDEHLRKATLADADAKYLDSVSINLKDALIEEGWLAHGDVGMPGTSIGGDLKDPKMRTLHNKKGYLEKCIRDGAPLFGKASQTPTALTPKETADLKKLETKKKELEEVKRLLALPPAERLEALAEDTNAGVRALDEKIDDNHNDLVERIDNLATKEDVEQLALGNISQPSNMTDDQWRDHLGAKIKQLQSLKKPLDQQKKELAAKAKIDKDKEVLAELAFQDPAKAQAHVQSLALRKQLELDEKDLRSKQKQVDEMLVKSQANPENLALSAAYVRALLDQRKLCLKLQTSKISINVDETATDVLKAQADEHKEEITQLQVEAEEKTKACVEEEAKRAEDLRAREARVELLRKRGSDLISQNERDEQKLNRAEKKDKKDKKEKKDKRQR